MNEKDRGGDTLIVVDYLSKVISLVNESAKESAGQYDGYRGQGLAVPVEKLGKFAHEYLGVYGDKGWEKALDRMHCARVWAEDLDTKPDEPGYISPGASRIIDLAAVKGVINSIQLARDPMAHIETLSLPDKGDLMDWGHWDDISTQTRWSVFMPEGFDNKQWRKLMGPDVDNGAHGFRQRQIVGFLANRMGWSENQEAFMRLVGELHDVGECIEAGSPNGGIVLDHKTEEMEDEEMMLLSTILYTHEPFRSLGEKTVQTILYTMDDAHNEDHGPRTQPGLVFDTSEKLGYLLTALTTADLILDATMDETAAQRGSSKFASLTDSDWSKLISLPMDVLGASMPALADRHMADESSIVPELDNLVRELIQKFGPRIRKIYDDFGTDEGLARYYEQSYHSAFYDAHSQPRADMTEAEATVKAITKKDAFLASKEIFNTHYPQIT